MPLINVNSLNPIYLRDLIKICGTHPPRHRPMARLLPRDRHEIKPGARYTYIYIYTMPLALLVRRQRRRRPIKPAPPSAFVLGTDPELLAHLSPRSILFSLSISLTFFLLQSFRSVSIGVANYRRQKEDEQECLAVESENDG